MAFENFWKRDRERYGEERNPERWRSEQRDDWRESARGGSERDWGGRYARGEDEDFGRRGWREGSDYYGNRDQSYGRGQYGRGGESDWERSRVERQGYGRGYEAESWRGEGESHPSNFEGRGFGRASYGGRFEDDDTSGGAYGMGGYGRDMDYGRRGALGYGGYGGMGGAESGSSLYGRGAYGQGEQGQFRGRGPRGYRRSDERIREDVCDVLTDDPYLDASNLEITVKDCEVTLSGTVSSREDKRRVEDLVEAVSGVKDVHNSVRVAREQRTSPESATTTQQKGQPRH